VHVYGSVVSRLANDFEKVMLCSLHLRRIYVYTGNFTHRQLSLETQYTLLILLSCLVSCVSTQITARFTTQFGLFQHDHEKHTSHNRLVSNPVVMPGVMCVHADYGPVHDAVRVTST
jgi:hypothetical protein